MFHYLLLANVFRYTTDGTDVEDATSTDISYIATPTIRPNNNIKCH